MGLYQHLPSAVPNMKRYIQLLLMLLIAAISIYARDSTITCDDCQVKTDIKWCQRCYTAPTHCTIEFSLSCNATVDEVCAGCLGQLYPLPGCSTSTGGYYKEERTGCRYLRKAALTSILISSNGCGEVWSQVRKAIRDTPLSHTS